MSKETVTTIPRLLLGWKITSIEASKGKKLTRIRGISFLKGVTPSEAVKALLQHLKDFP